MVGKCFMLGGDAVLFFLGKSKETCWYQNRNDISDSFVSLKKGWCYRTHRWSGNISCGADMLYYFTHTLIQRFLFLVISQSNITITPERSLCADDFQQW